MGSDDARLKLSNYEGANNTFAFGVEEEGEVKVVEMSRYQHIYALWFILMPPRLLLYFVSVNSHARTHAHAHIPTYDYF